MPVMVPVVVSASDEVEDVIPVVYGVVRGLWLLAREEVDLIVYDDEDLPWALAAADWSKAIRVVIPDGLFRPAS